MNTAPVKPMLDTLELSVVQVLRTEEDQVWVEHGVPALDGSLLQRLNRGPTRVHIEGALLGKTALDDMEALRKLYKAAQPVPFVADIMTATHVTQMLIVDLKMRELAGKPSDFQYILTLEEHVPTPEPPRPPKREDPKPTPCETRTGTIEVTVILPAGQTDFTGVVVRLQRTNGSGAEGEPPVEITEPGPGGVYRLENAAAGEYRATAIRR